MKKFKYKFLSLFILFTIIGSVSLAQQIDSVHDTMIALESLQRAKEFRKPDQLDSACYYFDKAAYLYKAEGSYELYFQCLEEKRFLYRKSSKLDIVLRDSKKLRNQLDLKTNDSLLLGGALYYIASDFYYLGKTDSAMIYLDSTYIYHHSRNDLHSYFGYLIYRLYSIIYASQDKLTKALDNIIQSVNIYKDLYGERSARYADIVGLMSTVYGRMFKFEEQKKYIRKALSILKSADGDNQAESLTLRNRLATAFLQAHEYDSALIVYQEILVEIKETMGEKNLAFPSALLSVGKVYAWKKEFHDALPYLLQAERIFAGQELYHTGENYYQCLYYLARCYQSNSDFAQAVHNYNKAIKLLIPEADTTLLAYTDYTQYIFNTKLISLVGNKAFCLKEIGKQNGDTSMLRLSIFFVNQMIKLCDQIPVTFYDTETQIYWLTLASFQLEKSSTIVTDIYQITRQKELYELLFTIIEKGKAANLLQSMHKNQIINACGIPDSLILRMESLQKSITQNKIRQDQLSSQKALSEKDKTALSDLQSKIIEGKRDHELLLNEVMITYPECSELRFKLISPKIEDIQQHLPDHKTMLIEYFMSDSSLILFWIKRDAFDFVTVHFDTSFNKHIQNFLSGIKEMEHQRYSASGFHLYKYLIEPLIPQLENISSLIIIPYAKLSYIPFEALITRQFSADHVIKDFTQVPYLIRDFDISYHYSVSLWASSNKRLSSKKTFELTAFAPVSWSNQAKSADTLNRVNPSSSNDFNSPLYSTLEHSEDEVQDIADLFKMRGFRYKAYTKDEATEKNFITQSGDTKIIHVASHSNFNMDSPSLSGIAFSGEKKEDSMHVNDGFLHMGEIYGLKIPADLIVLSSCETGAGVYNRGDGIMSIGRGFIYAGCKNVIYSLWKVTDKATSQLMNHFYTHIIGGETYPSSLREAKLDMIRNQETAIPKIWSSFVLIGQ